MIPVFCFRSRRYKKDRYGCTGIGSPYLSLCMTLYDRVRLFHLVERFRGSGCQQIGQGFFGDVLVSDDLDINGRFT